ncbi:hypothetical protein [Xanthomonas albilineans]|nr:hypothetical protein [Xanthomonas albilineans]
MQASSGVLRLPVFARLKRIYLMTKLKDEKMKDEKGNRMTEQRRTAAA